MDSSSATQRWLKRVNKLERAIDGQFAVRQFSPGLLVIGLIVGQSSVSASLKRDEGVGMAVGQVMHYLPQRSSRPRGRGYRDGLRSARSRMRAIVPEVVAEPEFARGAGRRVAGRRLEAANWIAKIV